MVARGALQHHDIAAYRRMHLIGGAMTTPTGPEMPGQRKSAISRLLDRWRKRRERIKRLNEDRYQPGKRSGYEGYGGSEDGF